MSFTSTNLQDLLIPGHYKVVPTNNINPKVDIKWMDDVGRFDYLKLMQSDPVIFNNAQNIQVPIVRNITETTTNVNGWWLVRYLPRTSTVWYQGNDSLVGNLTYGNPKYFTNTWSIPFGTFNEFCFSTANFAKWLYCTKDAVNGAIYTNLARPVIRSSSSNFSYMPKWYHRGQNTLEEPWISIGDYPNNVVNGENSIGMNTSLISTDGGMCVWVRNSNDTIPDTKHLIINEDFKYIFMTNIYRRGSNSI